MKSLNPKSNHKKKHRPTNKLMTILLVFFVSFIVLKSYVDEPDCIRSGKTKGVFPGAPECCLGSISVGNGDGVMGSATCTNYFSFFYLIIK
jgi:hypothetical protein